jgi:hypothetical protein
MREHRFKHEGINDGTDQIERVMEATVQMHGDLQGIAGKSIQEIEGLELKALSAGEEG